MNFHRNLEMSITREEFLRLLPAAVGPLEVDGETIRWSDGDRSRFIRLVPLPDRQLGAVTVSRYHVDIVFDASSEDEGEAFMARFHRAFLRGGG